MNLKKEVVPYSQTGEAASVPDTYTIPNGEIKGVKASPNFSVIFRLFVTKRGECHISNDELSVTVCFKSSDEYTGLDKDASQQNKREMMCVPLSVFLFSSFFSGQKFYFLKY